MSKIEVNLIYDIIRPCGLAQKKSKAIRKVLRKKILNEKYNGKVPKRFQLFGKAS